MSKTPSRKAYSKLAQSASKAQQSDDSIYNQNLSDCSQQDEFHDTQFPANRKNKGGLDNPLKKNQNNSRYSRSLDLLTKLFVEAIMKKENHQLDLGETAKALSIHKRRIYDITNVLQGIGYLQKVQKNVVRWIGSTQNPQLIDEINEKIKELQEVKAREKELIDKIQLMKEKIFQQFNNNEQMKQYLFITYADCQSVLKKEQEQNRQKMVLITGPRGTIVQMQSSETKDGKQNRVIVQSQNQPLNVYRCCLGKDPLLMKQQKNKKLIIKVKQENSESI